FAALLPPPPISSLFPYTTLFRSRVVIRRFPGAVPRIGVFRILHLTANLFKSRNHLPCATHRHRSVVAAVVGTDGDILDKRRLGRDRKSTRLNSSHVSISYAVFCL